MSSVNAGEVSARITINSGQAIQSIDNVIKALNTLNNRLDTMDKNMSSAVGKSAGAMISAMDKLGKSTQKTSNQIKRQVGHIKDWYVKLNQAYRTAFNFFQMGKLVYSFGKSIASVGAEVERMKASLQVITGGRGEETFNALSSFAARTNVTTQEAVKQYTQLRAVGLEPTIADMERLLDLTNAFGGSTAVFQRISKALGDIQAKGKLMGEEVRQLTNIGIPIRQILVDAGVLSKNMIDQIGKANISAQSVMQALFDYIDDNFKGITNQMMNTWAGTMERMKDTWWRWGRVIGESGFIDTLKGSIDGLTKSNDLLTFGLANLGQVLKQVVIFVKEDATPAFETLSTILYPIVKVLQILNTAVVASKQAVSDATEWAVDKFLFNKTPLTDKYGMTLDTDTAMEEARVRKQKQHIQSISDAIKESNRSKLIHDIWVGPDYEKAKQVMATSKELENQLDKASAGMGATPMTRVNEMLSNMEVAAQNAASKTERLQKSLNDLTAEYENATKSGGAFDTVLASMQEKLSATKDPAQKKILEGQLEEFKNRVELYKQQYPTALAYKQKQLQDEIARATKKTESSESKRANTLRNAERIMGSINAMYSKIVDNDQTDLVSKRNQLTN